MILDFYFFEKYIFNKIDSVALLNIGYELKFLFERKSFIDTVIIFVCLIVRRPLSIFRKNNKAYSLS
jgi:hypothetical protein